MRPIDRTAAPLHVVRGDAPTPRLERRVPNGAQKSYRAAAAAMPAAEARQDVQVTVRVFDHGGSAVVARDAGGGFDALVR